MGEESNKLYAGSLSYHTNDSSLRDYFQKCGEVVEGKLIQLKLTLLTLDVSFHTL